jgi:hypothetical protein
MYAGIKQSKLPSNTKSSPFKTKPGKIITDRRKQMEGWIEHYLELYSAHNVVTDAALSVINQMPVLDELNKEPTK